MTRLLATLLSAIVATGAFATDIDDDGAAIASQAERAGHRLVLLGRWDDAERVLRAALEIADAMQVPDGVAALQARLGYTLTHRVSHRGDSFQPAIELLEQSIEQARATADAVTEGNALAWLAQAHYHRRLWYEQGDYETVFELYKQAYDVRRKAGDTARYGESFFQLGIAEERNGSPRRAAKHYRKALAKARKHSDWLLASYALRHLTYLEKDKLTNAEILANHEQVLAWREQVDFAVGVLYGNLTVANLHIDSGHADRAAANVQTACAIAQRISSQRGQVSCLLASARLTGLQDDTKGTQDHCAAARRLAGQLSMPRLIAAAGRCGNAGTD